MDQGNVLVMGLEKAFLDFLGKIPFSGKRRRCLGKDKPHLWPNYHLEKVAKEHKICKSKLRGLSGSNMKS